VTEVSAQGTHVEDRLAVVTGAGRGIGRAICLRLAAGGMRVAAWDIDARSAQETADMVGQAGGTSLAQAVDVSRAEDVQASARALEDQLGTVSVLVNNAGWDRLSLFLESDPADWPRTVGVNYVAVLATCHAFAASISASADGRIVNVSSDTAKLGGPLEAVYSGSKAAVVSFSRALARELAESGTTVNVVCPGATDTPLYREIEQELETDPRFSHFFPDGLTTAVLRAIPLGRLGRPEDIAGAVAFFTRRSSSFITGQVLSVSGGQTMY
jgi:2-hydroxycyclohexanecarboxyl-CoA dehydrogenase